MNHRKAPNTEMFWRIPKQLNPAHPDYRPASDDLPILPGEWTYRKEVYELELAEMKSKQKNIAKLEAPISRHQR